MTDDYLLSCVSSLESTWKSVYGLGTQYIGYMTVDMIISVLSVRRYAYDYIRWNDENTYTLANINKLINELNSEGVIDYAIPTFPNNEDYAIAIPDLLKITTKYDLSEKSISETEWLQFINYLNSKRK